MNPTWIYLKIKIGDFLFITTGEPDKLQKIYNHEEKEEVFSFRTSGGHKFSVAYFVCPWQLSKEKVFFDPSRVKVSKNQKNFNNKLRHFFSPKQAYFDFLTHFHKC